MEGFGVAFFQIEWAMKAGPLVVFGTEAGCVAGLFLFVVPVLQWKGRTVRVRYSQSRRSLPALILSCPGTLFTFMSYGIIVVKECMYRQYLLMISLFHIEVERDFLTTMSHLNIHRYRAQMAINASFHSSLDESTKP